MNSAPFEKHVVAVGQPPTEKQLCFYNKFPIFRGISDRTLDTEILDAVLIAALNFGTASNRVYVFAPPKHEEWVITQFNKLAGVIFERCKMRNLNRGNLAKAYGMLFQRIILFGHLLQIEKEPQYWLSFGFTKDDPIPDWVSARLLPPIILP